MAKTQQEAIRILQLFNEKAEKLQRSSFTKYVETETIGFTVVPRGAVVDVYAVGPDPEVVEAFVLTLRFFVQDNEPTSFRNMGALYEELPIGKDLIRQFQEGRTAINSFLDRGSHMTVNGKAFSNREILEVFLWGGLAHANPTKKATFDGWLADGHLYPLMQMSFHDTLVELLRFVFWVREHNSLALDSLRPKV